MSKKQIAAGINGLLNTAPTTTQKPEANTNEERRPNRTVCYSLPSEVIDGIKYIAYFDRRKLNAVVTEAFAQYIERWNNAEHKIEKPKKA